MKLILLLLVMSLCSCASYINEPYIKLARGFDKYDSRTKEFKRTYCKGDIKERTVKLALSETAIEQLISTTKDPKNNATTINGRDGVSCILITSGPVFLRIEYQEDGQPKVFNAEHCKANYPVRQSLNANIYSHPDIKNLPPSQCPRR